MEAFLCFLSQQIIDLGGGEGNLFSLTETDEREEREILCVRLHESWRPGWTSGELGLHLKRESSQRAGA